MTDKQIEVTDAIILAEMIEARLLGVIPDDQDLELDDDDWRLILEGLRLVDATNQDQPQ